MAELKKIHKILKIIIIYFLFRTIISYDKEYNVHIFKLKAINTEIKHLNE